MRRTISILVAIGAIYAGSVIYGSAPRRSACWPDEEFVVFLAKQERGTEGQYAVRRTLPRVDELIPFQSAFVVSRDAEDCARVTLRRQLWSRDASYHFESIPTPKKMPNSEQRSASP